jgi:hypothetical protein
MRIESSQANLSSLPQASDFSLLLTQRGLALGKEQVMDFMKDFTDIRIPGSAQTDDQVIQILGEDPVMAASVQDLILYVVRPLTVKGSDLTPCRMTSQTVQKTYSLSVIRAGRSCKGDQEGRVEIPGNGIFVIVTRPELMGRVYTAQRITVFGSEQSGYNCLKPVVSLSHIRIAGLFRQDVDDGSAEGR